MRCWDDALIVTINVGIIIINKVALPSTFISKNCTYVYIHVAFDGYCLAARPTRLMIDHVDVIVDGKGGGRHSLRHLAPFTYAPRHLYQSASTRWPSGCSALERCPSTQMVMAPDLSSVLSISQLHWCSAVHCPTPVVVQRAVLCKDSVFYNASAVLGKTIFT